MTAGYGGKGWSNMNPEESRIHELNPLAELKFA